MDKEIIKIAKILAHLWHIRDIDPQYYSKHKMGHEKEDIYVMHGSDRDLMFMAKEFDNQLAGGGEVIEP